MMQSLLGRHPEAHEKAWPCLARKWTVFKRLSIRDVNFPQLPLERPFYFKIQVCV
jgi:hypothetical protein